MELAVAVTAGGFIAELGTAPLDVALVAALGLRLGGTGIVSYGVALVVDGDGSENPAKDLLDFGLEDEFESAARELGLPVWEGRASRAAVIGPSEPDERSPWTAARILLTARGPAAGHHVDVNRAIWLADRLGGDALLAYGVNFSAERDLRLDGYILDDAWCAELCDAFSGEVAALGLAPWPIDCITIQPAGESPAGWAEERRYRPWPPWGPPSRGGGD